MLLITVEHSGTHRAIELLGRSTCPLEERSRWQPHQLLFAHLYDDMMPLILETADRMTTITTFRPMADIEASWMSRGRDLSDLARQAANYQTLLLLKPYVLLLGRP